MEKELRAAQKHDCCFWSGERDGVKITIVSKADRSPILVLQQHTKGQRPHSICQVGIKFFGDPKLEDEFGDGDSGDCNGDDDVVLLFLTMTMMMMMMMTTVVRGW